MQTAGNEDDLSSQVRYCFAGVEVQLRHGDERWQRQKLGLPQGGQHEVARNGREGGSAVTGAVVA